MVPFDGFRPGLKVVRGFDGFRRLDFDGVLTGSGPGSEGGGFDGFRQVPGF